jgi:hypothetical protein
MADQNFTGVVEFVRKNDAGYWSVKTIDGQWFGTGKVKPACSEGDEVAFDYALNGKYNNMELDTLEVISSGNAIPEKAAKKAWSGGKKGGDTRDASYWDAKDAQAVKTQKEIRFQASRNAAIAVIDVALKAGVLTIPEGKAADAQFKVLLTYVDKVTDRYNKATEALDTPVAAAVAKPKAAPKPKLVVVEEVEAEEEDENDFA